MIQYYKDNTIVVKIDDIIQFMSYNEKALSMLIQ